MVDGYSEYTGCILDHNNNIVETINRLFDSSGEYSKSVNDLVVKYNINLSTIGNNKGLFMVSGNSLTAEKAVEKYKEDMDTQKRINDFLTPEMSENLIKLFKSKD